MAPADDDISIEEKRVYAGTGGRTDAYVAAGMGLVRVSISADMIGGFEMVARDAARDVAVLGRNGGGDLLAVATDEDLRVARLGDGRDGGDGSDEGDRGDGSDGREQTGGSREFEDTDLGATVAVGAYGDGFLAATAAGRVARVTPDGADDGEWTATGLGEVPDPRAVDGPLIAAGDGVHRVVDRGRAAAVEHVGLDDVRDVAGAGVPLAATPEGLYWLGNGWMDALSGSFDVVAADGDGHAMAAGGEAVYVREGSVDDGQPHSAGGWDADAWRAATLPVEEPAVALGYGPGLSVAVTEAGTLCVDAGDGWRHQALGVRDVEGVALTVVE